MTNIKKCVILKIYCVRTPDVFVRTHRSDIDYKGETTVEISLGEIINILKKRIVGIIIAGLVCAAIMFGYTNLFLVPQYTATSKLYVYNGKTNNQGYIGSVDLTAAKSLVDTYIVIIKSDSLLDEVARRLQPEYDGLTAKQILGMLSAGAVNQTESFKVSITSENPKMSMDIVNTLVDCLPDEFKRIVKVGSIEVIDKAKLPTVPEWPLKRNMALGAVVGMFVISAVFVLLAVWDRTVYDKEILTENFEIPIIGTIPDIDGFGSFGGGKTRNIDGKRTTEHERKMILNENTPFSVAEAYRMARTNIMYLPSEKKCKIFATTSAYASEGKTITSINLAIAFAQSNKRIILIDADMRKPRVKKNMELKTANGLSEYLAGITDEAEIVHLDNLDLDVITAGKTTAAAAELLELPRMKILLDKLSESYDYILIDTPPMNLVTDAAVLTNLINGYIFSVRCEFSDLDGIKDAVLALQQVNANIVGFVLNGIDPKLSIHGKYRYRYSKYGYSYRYGYAYGYKYKEESDDDKKKKRTANKPKN